MTLQKLEKVKSQKKIVLKCLIEKWKFDRGSMNPHEKEAKGSETQRQQTI